MEHEVKNHRVSAQLQKTVTITFKDTNGNVIDVIFPRALAIMLNVDLTRVLKETEQ